MVKVVYNAQFGGFSLSREAVKMGRELSGDGGWAGAILPEECPHDGHYATRRGMSDVVFIDDCHPRHDPILVQVVERLGDAASGCFARLKIASVRGKYRIDEYDGFESVETPDSYEWVELPPSDEEQA